MSIERAFCRNKEHLPAFRACGLPDKLTYLDGRGAEDLESCITSFRGRPGKLLVAPDLRVFGKSIKAVEAATARLEKAKIRVVDIIHPQHDTVAEMLGFARNKIAKPRFRDRRTARLRGQYLGRRPKFDQKQAAAIKRDRKTMNREAAAKKWKCSPGTIDKYAS